MTITIDPEFKSIIPPLSPEEFIGLDESIRKEGCRDPIVLWNELIIDGHNRFKICNDHAIPFKIIDVDLPDRISAKIWLIRNQFSRRNLNAFQRSELALVMEPLFVEKAKENLVVSTGGAKPRPLPKSAKVAVDTREEVAKIAGVSHDTIAKVKKIKEKAPVEVLVQLRDTKKTPAKTSINKVYKDIKRDEKKAERQKNVIENPVLPDGLYNVILADPPWEYNFSETQSRKIDNQYPTMDLGDIKKLNLPIEENAVLFLWATAPKLEEALEVLNAWGFDYKTCAIWDKEYIGMGYWFRIQHELLLVGTIGTFRTPETGNRVSSVIKSARSTHSTKPEIIYEMLEKMFPNKKYLEVFARSNRTGWVSWGNQI